MNYTLSPQSFSVNEIFNPLLKEKGPYYYYTLEKKNISHSIAARRIGVKTWFAGIKDKNASTKQWFCTIEKIPEVNEEDFKIKFRGCSNERIFVGAHKGNSFKIIVELDQNETKALKHFNPKKELLCNYFGEQRFGSNILPFNKALEEKNFELALNVFLIQESKHDSKKSTAIKKVIKENWGNWEKILQSSEIKGTGKVQLFEFLNQHHNNFEEAFNYAEPKSLRIMLKACQSMRFNEKLNLLAREKKPKNINAQIVGHFPEYALSASKAFTRSIEIDPTEFEKKFRKTPLKRKTFFAVQKFKAKKLNEPKLLTFELSFELGRGEYATIFLKFLETWLANKINKGFYSN